MSIVSPQLPKTITVTPEELERLMDARIDKYEREQYKSFLSLFDEERIPDLIRGLSRNGDSAGVDYLLEFHRRFGTERFEQFLDYLYEESGEGTHIKLKDLGADGGPLFTEMFRLKQPDTSYVDSVTRREAMRRVGQAAKYLLAAEAALGTGSLVGFALMDENDPKQRRALMRYNEYVVAPVAIVCSGVIAVHYGYENKVDHINAQLEQIERKLQLIEDGINQLVDKGRTNYKEQRGR